MRRVLVSLLVVTALAIAAPPASALGFSTSKTPSLLGRPLDFDAVVRLAPDESLERACVSASVRAGEIPVPAEQVRVALRNGADPAERVVHVSTLRALDEPIVTVEVGVGCGARVVRSFVAFLDPPALQLAKAGDDAPPSVEAAGPLAPQPRLAERTPEVAGRAPAATPDARGTAHAALAAHRVAAAARHAAAPSGHEAHPARAPRAAALAARAGPRLTLEAPTSLAASPHAARAGTDPGPPVGATPAGVAGALPLSSGGSAPLASDPPAAAVADAERARLVAELAQARARLQEIEAGVTRMRQEEQGMRRSMIALQARLQQAEAGGDARPLVWLLGALCVLLLGALALAWRGSPLARRWWEATQLAAAAAAPLAAPGPAPLAAGPAAVPDDGPLTESAHDEPWTYRRARLEASSAPAAPAPIGGLEVTTVLDHGLLAQIAAGHTAPAPEDQAAPIDHLIDVEQQAEFFLVLGQEDRAIELLGSQLQGPAGDSPMPYLHLLALHRRRGERAAWLRVAERLRARFGGEPRAWSDETDDEPSLEAHHAVTERLQRVWAWPGEAMRALEGWLFHRHGGDARFGWGAYDDLLTLYGLAREHAETPTGIDLLLPIGDSRPAPIEAMPAFRISNFGAIDVPLRRALDLDVSAPGPFDSRPAPLRRAG
jgi:hypothetical protein